MITCTSPEIFANDQGTIYLRLHSMTDSNHFSENKTLTNSRLINSRALYIYLLAAILIAIPLNYAFGSITTIVFVAAVLATVRRKNIAISAKRLLFFPIALYGLMVLSLCWTTDSELTFGGLQKELTFLFIPIAFILMPELGREQIDRVFRFFSFAMAGYALYYFIRAGFRYYETKSTAVFFFHELVTVDLSAIYVSVFASFAIFYFISVKVKTNIERTALWILIILVFLLSSKTIITIDFLLIVCYYCFFSEIPVMVRITTLVTATAFLLFSLVYVKEVREKFLLEYETAFVDNTLNNQAGNDIDKVYNVSIRQAWYNEKFHQNNFLPGTALRVYQVRIFKEMLQENDIFFTGFGLEASKEKIHEKTTEHGLYPDYGALNFHNQYVQFFAELGIGGLLILAGMLFFNLKNAWSHKDFLHIAFAITMIILFLTESFFCRQRGVLFFIVIYCMFNTMAPARAEKATQKI